MKWLDIPGLNYEISDTCMVRNKKTGRIKSLQMCGRDANPRVVLNYGYKYKQGSFAVARLLFAAMKGIDPREIGNKYLFTFKGNHPCAANLQVMERRQVLNFYREKGRKKTSGEEFYSCCERFCHCARNKDAGGLAAIIEENKEALMRIIRQRIKNEEICQETYRAYVNALIDCVVSRRYLVIDLLGYTRKVFRRARIYQPVDVELIMSGCHTRIGRNYIQ